MDLLKKTLELCEIYNIKPSKSKGQNFLIKESIYDEIVALADLNKEDLVLEVGPGLGFLTFKLASKAKKVLAIEVDPKIVEFLKTAIQSQGIKNIKIFQNDILKAKGDNFAKLGRYKVVSNLPYNISSVFLRKFLSLAHQPELMVLLLQKEVAQRIVSRPPDMNLLALSVQFYAQAEIISELGRENFYPSPQVDSAIIKITPWSKRRLKDYNSEKKFFSILKIAFSAKRKMLKNNLSSGLKISLKEIERLFLDLQWDNKIRAEELSIDQWLKFYKKIQ